VPNAWGFLIFCAAWTFLVAIFHLVITLTSATHGLISCIQLGAEAVALLSWFAGFIAVAANIGTGECHVKNASCASLEAATVFGAFEWLLFMVTTTLTAMVVFGSARRSRTSTADSSIAMKP